MPDKRNTHLSPRRQVLAERIRKAAATLFLQRGYDDVSIDDIIAVSGGSKTNVYTLFKGKEQLFIAVIGDLCDQYACRLAAVDVSELPAAEGMRAFGEQLLGMLLEEQHLAFYRLAIGYAGRVAGVGREWRKHGPDAAYKLMSRFIAARQECGELRADFDPHAAAHLFHDMVVYHLVHRAVVGDRPPVHDQRAILTASVELFMRGYGTGKVEAPGRRRRDGAQPARRAS